MCAEVGEGDARAHVHVVRGGQNICSCDPLWAEQGCLQGIGLSDPTNYFQSCFICLIPILFYFLSYWNSIPYLFIYYTHLKFNKNWGHVLNEETGSNSLVKRIIYFPFIPSSQSLVYIGACDI